MKKPVYWILALLLALIFLYVIKNYDSETNSVNTAAVGNTINVIKSKANNVADTVEDGVEAAEDAVDAVEDGIEEAVDAVEDGVEAAGDLAEDTVDAVEDGIEEAVDAVEDVVEGDEAENEVVIENDGYQEFSEEEMKQAVAKGKNVALFFHADRCPSCVALDEVIVEGEEGIDENTVVFKVNYDTAKDLADRYNVTSQHTVVYLDDNLEASMLKGGITSLDELTTNFGA